MNRLLYFIKLNLCEWVYEGDNASDGASARWKWGRDSGHWIRLERSEMAWKQTQRRHQTEMERYRPAGAERAGAMQKRHTDTHAAGSTSEKDRSIESHNIIACYCYSHIMAFFS